MSWHERVPLCALQDKLARIESEIDEVVAGLDFDTQALWRSVVEPDHVFQLPGVPHYLREDYRAWAVVVRDRQRKEYKALMAEFRQSADPAVAAVIAESIEMERRMP